MRLALGGILVLAALAAGWPVRALIRTLAVPAGSDGPHAQIERDTSGVEVPAGDAAPADHTAPSASQPRAVYIGLCAAVLVAALTARTGPVLVLAAYCWLAATTVPLAWIDAAVHRLPDVLTGSAYAGTLLLLLGAAAHSGDWGSLLRAVIGGLALAAGYFALAVVRPAGMGLGDVKLSASLGTAMAWIGWTALLAGTLAGFVLAACYGVVLLAAHRATLRQHIPLGPFMIVGTFLALAVVGDGLRVH